MDRRSLLKWIASAAMLPRRLWANTGFSRRRPTDAAWPSKSAWQELSDAVGGNLIPVDFPLAALKADPSGEAARLLKGNVKNPYYVGDQPGLTQSFGWLDAWATSPSVYAVAARNANDIAAAVNFARENHLRLAVKGGGHSYQGTSNAPDSLLIWTRHLRDIALHDEFVPQGCQDSMLPQPAVTVGAGTLGIHAYDAVMTKAGRYVQGGGCVTVGLAGLVQSGGFGSFSKHYGLAAGSLLEAEVITADGQVRIANAGTNPDLFWALKGGGGGTFGVVSKMILRTHALPQWFATVNFTVEAASDDAYRKLLRQFISFYKDHIFNDHWGEQVHVNPSNTLEVTMLGHGIDREQAQTIWEPFLAWVKDSANGCSTSGRMTIGAIPAQHFWDPQWWTEHWPEVALPRDGSMAHAVADELLLRVMKNPVFAFDGRPEAGPNDAWFSGSTGEVAAYWWGYESLWLPDSLLQGDEQQQRLADALYAGSRSFGIGLHFNKGLAGAPPEALAAAKDTAMNPAVLGAFALAIVAGGEDTVYPGIPGHEPSAAKGREAARRIEQCMSQLRAVAGADSAYVSESNYFQKNFQQAYWGPNYSRLAEIKQTYDPDGLFIVHNGVGSDQWSADGFTKL